MIVTSWTSCEDTFESCALIFEPDSDGLFGAANFFVSQVELPRSWTYTPFYHRSIQTIELCLLLDKMLRSFREHVLELILTRSGAV